jgi:hypothetical protein
VCTWGAASTLSRTPHLTRSQGPPHPTLPHRYRSFFDLDERKLSSAHYAAKVAAGGAASVPGFPAVTALPVPGAADITADTPAAAAFSRLIAALTRARINPYAGHRLRAVVHHQVTDDDVELVIKGAAAAAALLS